ncbi:MAG: hypothetical protein ABF518_04510 [Liquorilactobacillus ghanensis]|jgi:hypothetical protein
MILIVLLAIFIGTVIELIAFKEKVSELLKKRHANVRRADHRFF